MIEEGMSIKGSITLLLAKPTGEVEVVHKDNIIVNGGFDFVADAIGNSASRPGVMAVSYTHLTLPTNREV